MLIAKKGNFVLCHETYLGNRKLTTYSIEVCKIVSDGSRYTVAKLEDGNVKSINLRLLECIDSIEDVEDLKILCEIMYNIKMNTEELECQ